MTLQQANDATPLHVPGDLPCGNCGYNLRTLDWEGNCPECGRPVCESRLLPGFRFSGLRASRRLRIVLGLLVVATLVAVLIEIWVTYVFLTWFPTVNKTKFNIAPYFWQHTSTIVAIVQFAAICFFQRLPGGVASGTPLRLPRLALGVGIVDLVVYLVLSAMSRPFGSGRVGSLARVMSVFDAVAVVGSLLAVILVWICLLRLIDRRAGCSWWQATAIVVGLVVLVRLDHLEWLVEYVSFGLTGTYAWEWTDWRLYDFAETCRRFVCRPCSTLLMLLVWVYLRKLNAASRQARGVASG